LQTVFGKPTGALKGIIAASYSLGAILSLPFVPYLNQWFGRRWSIMFGSLVMVFGALLQGFANGGMKRLIIKLLESSNSNDA
jgi:MFS family permease